MVELQMEQSRMNVNDGEKEYWTNEEGKEIETK